MFGKIKKISAVILAIVLILPMSLSTMATESLPFDVNARSAVLIDAETGTVMYNKNGDEALPPASVTKVMTLLLIMEALDSVSIKDIINDFLSLVNDLL